MSEYTTNNNTTDECLRTSRERGVCPVKKEYLQYVQVRKNNNNINDNGNNNKNNNVKDNKCDHDNADSDSEDTLTNNGSTADENSKNCENVIVVVGNDHRKRQRGMNKPNDRLQSDSVSGAERPTLEGEMNFFHSATLQRIKVAVKEARKVGSSALNTSKYMEVEKVGRMEKISDSQCHDINPCIESDCTFTRNDIVSKLSDTSNDDKAINVTNSTTVKANNECNNLLTSLEITQKCGNSVIYDVDSNKTTKICETDSESNKHVSEREVEMSRENQAKTREMLSGKLILAPLTTVGNLPFRRVCKTFGADVTMSEMAIAFNLNRMQKSEWALLRRHESEDIFGIQIAVGKVHEAYTFARAIEASEFKYDFLDINCGCPVDKVVSSGCGCGLWEKKARLRDVVQTLCRYQHQPVTIKTRIGIDETSPSLHHQIREYEMWGASGVCIHGRSRKQRYTHRANWEYINTCATLTSLPVIGNGDIMSWEDVYEHRKAHPQITACMIGRGALIKPWVFDEVKSGQVKDITSIERLEMLKQFCNYGLAHWGADVKGVMTTRRFLCEWLSFLCRYVPAGLLEYLPQRINERPPYYIGRNDLETLFASDNVNDWISISEMLLGPVEKEFHFTPKHKSNSYNTSDQKGSESIDAFL